MEFVYFFLVPLYVVITVVAAVNYNVDVREEDQTLKGWLFTLFWPLDIVAYLSQRIKKLTDKGWDGTKASYERVYYNEKLAGLYIRKDGEWVEIE